MNLLDTAVPSHLQDLMPRRVGNGLLMGGDEERRAFRGQVKTMHASGMSVSAISEALGVDWRRVRYYIGKPRGNKPGSKKQKGR